MTSKIGSSSLSPSPLLQPATQNYPSYRAFKEKFNLKLISTERENPKTVHLSETMLRDREVGLSLLLDQETRVISGFRDFAPKLTSLAATLAEKAKHGGRIIFVGIGSSGRLGIDLVAKAAAICPQLKCLGIVGGGDCALIQSSEGVEDSSERGDLAAEKLNLTPLDSVFLISASGATSFNVGFGDASANSGANVYYFYNSREIPERTQALFKRARNPVHPLEVDIGPQSILGSTRLQAYNVARICFGYLLGQTIGNFEQTPLLAEFSVDNLCMKLTSALEKVDEKTRELKALVDEEHAVFSNPSANFRCIRDITNGGYITMLGTPPIIRDLLIECAEIPPTFFLNQRRKENELQKRRAEYQAYLVDEQDNQNAWRVVLGRDPYFLTDRQDTLQFVLASKAPGTESYENRPKGPGNLVIGVDSLPRGATLSASLIDSLRAVKAQGGRTALIVVSEAARPSLSPEITAACDFISWIDDLENDPLGITFSQVLKWECSLISNGAMIMMGKVLGNRMIDVRTSTLKLIDRCMRLIHELWNVRHPHDPLNDQDLYYSVIGVYEKQKIYQDRGVYTPSTLKITLTTLEFRCSFEEALKILAAAQENLDLLRVPPRAKM